MNEATEKLAGGVRKAKPTKLAEFYSELFPDRPAPISVTTGEIVEYIRAGIAPEEVVDLWDVAFPEDRNVWHNEQEGLIHYNEEVAGYVDWHPASFDVAIRRPPCSTPRFSTSRTTSRGSGRSSHMRVRSFRTGPTEQGLRSDLLRGAWMSAVGALDAYYCDAYADLVAATANSKSRSPESSCWAGSTRSSP